MKIIKNNISYKKPLNSKQDPYYFILNQDLVCTYPNDKTSLKLVYSTIKDSISINNNWSDAIYTFNKQSSKHLPVLDLNASNLIKSYFNMYSKSYESKIDLPKGRFRLRFRRLSVNRLFTSKINVKHTFSNVILTVSVYNPEKAYLLNRWKKLRTLENLTWKSKSSLAKSWYVSERFAKPRNRKNGSSFRYSAASSYLSNYFWSNKKDFLKIIKELKSLNNILKLVSYQHGNISSFISNINTACHDLYLNSTLNLELYIKKLLLNRYYYLRLLNINQHKYTSIYVERLLPLLKNIYNKNVSLNIINIKSFYYNSEIFTKLIAMKLRNKESRLYNILLKAINMFSRFPRLKKETLMEPYSTTLSIKDNGFIVGKKAKLNKSSFSPLIKYLYNSTNSVKTSILKNTRNTRIIGLRVEAKGRLTKRMTAARAIYLAKYKGSIQNFKSSYRGLSSPLLRGHQSASLQHNLIPYKSRVGAYGIKGWIASN